MLSKEQEILNLGANEGKVIVKNGKKIAVYKDEAEKINSVSAVCTHLGCTLDWNNKDKTWDCPCHGSRFSKLGFNIKGPATKDLPKVE